MGRVAPQKRAVYPSSGTISADGAILDPGSFLHAAGRRGASGGAPRGAAPVFAAAKPCGAGARRSRRPRCAAFCDTQFVGTDGAGGGALRLCRRAGPGTSNRSGPAGDSATASRCSRAASPACRWTRALTAELHQERLSDRGGDQWGRHAGRFRAGSIGRNLGRGSAPKAGAQWVAAQRRRAQG